jgi:hypothetical protein
MHPGVEALGYFRIDIGALADNAAEGRLDMGSGTAEPVVKVEVAEGGVHVIPPHQSDHPAAEPDAFRVAGRPIYQPSGLGELVNLALGILGGIGRLGGGWLVAALGVAALGESGQGRKHTSRRDEGAETETHEEGHGGPVEFGSLLFAKGVLRYLNIEWVRFAACAARTCDM